LEKRDKNRKREIEPLDDVYNNIIKSSPEEFELFKNQLVTLSDRDLSIRKGPLNDIWYISQKHLDTFTTGERNKILIKRYIALMEEGKKPEPLPASCSKTLIYMLDIP
jgi:hypothetical protein